MTDFISRFFDWLAEPTPPPPPPSERRLKELEGAQNTNPADDWKRYDDAYRQYEAHKTHRRSLSMRLRVRAWGTDPLETQSIGSLLLEAAAEIDRLTAALNRAKNAPP